MLDKIKLMADLDIPSNAIQQEFLRSPARFKIFRAARRVGKSFIAAQDVFPDILMPNTRGWIVGPTYDLASKEFRFIMDFFLRANKKIGLPNPAKMRFNPKAGELYIETHWGSEVHGKTADKPVSLVGEELDWIILSESVQLKPEIWFSYLRPTLSIRNGRAIFPTTPSLDGKWLYDLENYANATEDNDWATFHCPAWKADHFNKEEIENLRKELPEDAFREQIGGEWVFYVGRVFKEFRDDRHIIPGFEIPRDWPLYAGIDYGNRDATAVMLLTRSPEGSYYIIDEYYAHDKPTIIHTAAVLDMESQYGRRPNVRVADHHALGKQLMLDWARAGVTTISVNVDRKTRRDRFMALLESRDGVLPFHIRESGGVCGRYPQLFIFRKCKNLIREISFLKWRDGSRQEGTMGDTMGDDHAIDASEYIASWASMVGLQARGSAPGTLRYAAGVSRVTGY